MARDAKGGSGLYMTAIAFDKDEGAQAVAGQP